MNATAGEDVRLHDPARVVHYVHADNGRGIASVVRSVAGEMARMGLRVSIVAGTCSDASAPPAGVELVDLGGSTSRTVTAVGRLRTVLRGLDPAVVFSHGNGPNRALVLATRAWRRPPRLVGVEHNHYSSYPWNLPAVRRVANRVLLPCLDVVLGVSDGVAEDLAATFPALHSRIGVVPPPLTRFERIPALAGAPLDHPWFQDDVPVVTTVGHVHPRKDHRTLVRAMGRVRDVAGPRAARLVVIGSVGGPEADVVRGLVTDLDLDDSVDLVGEQANPLAYVARSAVFALSSRNEGMPLVLLEALSVGTPVVSTDCPSGPAYALAGGEYGLLVPVGDADALGDAILRLLRDDQLHARLAASGPDRAASFSPASVARQYLEAAGIDP